MLKPLLRRRNMKTKFAAFHGMVSSEVLDSRTESRFSEWNETIRENGATELKRGICRNAFSATTTARGSADDAERSSITKRRFGRWFVSRRGVNLAMDKEWSADTATYAQHSTTREAWSGVKFWCIQSGVGVQNKT